MGQAADRKGLSSVSWMIVLLIGLGLAVEWIGTALSGIATSPVNWNLVADGLVGIAVIAIPFVVMSRILWVRREKPPSLAFVVTLMSGCFFFLFSLIESIIGFIPPYNESEAIGGLMQILVFALPFFIASWLLWARPRIGGIFLVCVGVAMGIWMIFGWNVPRTVVEWIIRMILVGLPIILGVFTFIRESSSRLRPAGKNAVS